MEQCVSRAEAEAEAKCFPETLALQQRALTLFPLALEAVLRRPGPVVQLLVSARRAASEARVVSTEAVEDMVEQAVRVLLAAQATTGLVLGFFTALLAAAAVLLQ